MGGGGWLGGGQVLLRIPPLGCVAVAHPFEICHNSAWHHSKICETSGFADRRKQVSNCGQGEKFAAPVTRIQMAPSKIESSTEHTYTRTHKTNKTRVTCCLRAAATSIHVCLSVCVYVLYYIIYPLRER